MVPVCSLISCDLGAFPVIIMGVLGGVLVNDPADLPAGESVSSINPISRLSPARSNVCGDLSGVCGGDGSEFCLITILNRPGGTVVLIFPTIVDPVEICCS